MGDDAIPKNAGSEVAVPLRIVPASEYWRGVMERGGSFACHAVGDSAKSTGGSPPGAVDPEIYDRGCPPVPQIVAPPKSARLVGAMGYAQFVNVKEFSEALEVNEKTVYGMIKRGELRASKAGRILRIPVAELQRLSEGAVLASCTKSAKASPKARAL